MNNQFEISAETYGDNVMGYLVYTSKTHQELFQGCHFYSEMEYFPDGFFTSFIILTLKHTYDKSMIRAQPILNLCDFKKK